MHADLRQLGDRDWVDEEGIVDGVLAGLGGRPIEEITAALVAALGPDRAAELGSALLAA